MLIQPRTCFPVLSLRRRPPPRSRLFPYTTLFRSLAAGGKSALATNDDLALNILIREALRDRDVAYVVFADERSEEHTSELQSRLHLVCRLLLEKKKN